MSGHALQRKGQPQKHAHTDTHGHTGPRTGAGDAKDTQGSQGALGPCSQAGTGGVVSLLTGRDWRCGLPADRQGLEARSAHPSQRPTSCHLPALRPFPLAALLK